MAWINLDQNYFQHPKTVRLRNKLGSNADVIPIRIWCHCSIYHEKDGILTNYDESELKKLFSYRIGVQSVLIALIDCGFLEKIGDNIYKVHDWEEIQGHLIAYSIRGKKAAKARWDKIEIGKQYAEQRRNDPPRGVNSIPF